MKKKKKCPLNDLKITLNYNVHEINEKEFYREPSQEELDGNYRITGPYVALTKGKWNNWDMATHENVVGDYAHTFLETKDGEPSYAKFKHSKDPRDRFGKIIEAKNVNGNAIQRVKITHPEGVRLYDAKLLGKRVSIEADPIIDYKNSTPDNLVVTGYKGSGVAFLDGQACVTCPSIQLEQINGIIEKIKLEEDNLTKFKKDDKGEYILDAKGNKIPEDTPAQLDEEGVKGIFGKLLEEFGIKKPASEPPVVVTEPPVKKEGVISLADNEEYKLLLQKQTAQEQIILEQKDTINKQGKTIEKLNDYVEKTMELSAQRERLALETEIKDCASKLEIELEDNHFFNVGEDGKILLSESGEELARSNEDLQGELAGLKLSLSRFPDGPLPIILNRTKVNGGKDISTLEKEVKDLESEFANGL